MKSGDSNLLWLRDTLEHLRGCQRHLEWTTDQASVHVLTETMLRDLERCRRLCELLQRRSGKARTVSI
jgi:hypothetical protein